MTTQYIPKLNDTVEGSDGCDNKQGPILMFVHSVDGADKTVNLRFINDRDWQYSGIENVPFSDLVRVGEKVILNREAIDKKNPVR